MKNRKIQAVIFYLDAQSKKQFLLLKMNCGFWQNVTGSVEGDEEFVQAAIREVQEETSLALNNIENIMETDKEFFFHDKWGKDAHEKLFIIQCKNFWNVIIDPSEHTEFEWVPEPKIQRSSVHYISNYESLELAMSLKC